MPGFDRKGSTGTGPMTGRGRGLCGSRNMENDQKTQPNINLESGIGNTGRQRLGQGFGYGGRQGMGQGFGKMRTNKRFGGS